MYFLEAKKIHSTTWKEIETVELMLTSRDPDYCVFNIFLNITKSSQQPLNGRFIF